jgi:hypothetical protein
VLISGQVGTVSGDQLQRAVCAPFVNSDSDSGDLTSELSFRTYESAIRHVLWCRYPFPTRSLSVTNE